MATASDRDGKTINSGAQIVLVAKARVVSTAPSMLVTSDKQVLQAIDSDCMLASTLDAMKHHERHPMGVLNFANPVSSVTLLIDDFSAGLAGNTYQIPIDRACKANTVAIRATTLSASPPSDWILNLYKNGTKVGTKGISLATNPSFGVVSGAWSVVGGQNLDYVAGDRWYLDAAGTGINAIGIFVSTGWLVTP